MRPRYYARCEMKFTLHAQKLRSVQRAEYKAFSADNTEKQNQSVNQKKQEMDPDKQCAWSTINYMLPRLIRYLTRKINFVPMTDESSLRPCPHVSGYFFFRKYLFADAKIFASTRSVFESFSAVHTYPEIF